MTSSIAIKKQMNNMEDNKLTANERENLTMEKEIIN